MNAIILARSETLLSSLAAATPAFNADEIIGWKTEAQRLALGANRDADRARVRANADLRAW
jgi:hypothetical protein